MARPSPSPRGRGAAAAAAVLLPLLMALLAAATFVTVASAPDTTASNQQDQPGLVGGRWQVQRRQQLAAAAAISAAAATSARLTAAEAARGAAVAAAATAAESSSSGSVVAPGHFTESAGSQQELQPVRHRRSLMQAGSAAEGSGSTTGTALVTGAAAAPPLTTPKKRQRLVLRRRPPPRSPPPHAPPPHHPRRPQVAAASGAGGRAATARASPSPRPPSPRPPPPPPSPQPASPPPTGLPPPPPLPAPGSVEDRSGSNPDDGEYAGEGGLPSGSGGANATDADNSMDEPEWPPFPPPHPRDANAPSPPPPPPPAPGSRHGQYEFIGNAMIIAVHLMSVPGTDNFLFMERPSGRHPDGSRTIAGFLNLPTRAWTHLYSPDGLFCAGHAFLDSGDLLIVGGHQANAGYPDGMKSVRTFNRTCTDLQLRKTVEMGWKRWYPSATLLPDGNVLVMGGTQGVGAGTANNPFWEMYYPQSQTTRPFAMKPNYLDSAEQVYYPFNYLLPSGLLFTFCGRAGYILDYANNTWLQNVPRLRGWASTQYPFTGTSVMLGLYPEAGYQVEIMLFGGQAERATRNLSTIASRQSQRLSLGAYDPVSRNYTFGPTGSWVSENLASPRVMGDSVLLPNGKVVLLNGAQTGLAGDSASGGDSRADFPVLFAELYDPDRPLGQRVRSLAFSRIPRMYHSTACLTTNGSILVAGCDRCQRFEVDPGWAYDPSPTGKADYRLELLHPPFVFFPADRPIILTPSLAASPPPPPRAPPPPPPPPPPSPTRPRQPLPGQHDDVGVAMVLGYGTTHQVRYAWPAGFAGPQPGSSSSSSSSGGGGNATTGPADPYDVLTPGVITRAVLVAPCSNTHSFDMHQRLVGLEILSDLPDSSTGGGGGGGNVAGGVLTVRGPPHVNIAPPGMYHLFLVNGDVYSTGVWVRLARPQQ
ncbi:hypothetical protein HXX76_009880 [Chlamydomonas incerta]|uniref:Glyoxal or galactose oxidase n=1 Tax=Chlamydomonas incerta TaxID=51695 RepID=A0A835ST09_CHLIN|nr:hypothetical protein HXX76_009880 [Chlamydomonas incerta]|eukprot:KAG2430907.1 hypothetical protein HXX76_009880 [Chlamydomonas incerta]